jgi:predicted acyltransferase
VVCPIVKSIWTPSWTIFSAGLVTLALACLYHVVDVRGHRGWTLPFVVAGRNSLLLYALALHYRWWVLEAWQRGLGRGLFAGYWGPVLESVACGLTLWLIAVVAYRWRVFVRL